MGKVKYIFRRIASMDFKNMVIKAREVSKKAHKPTLFILIDMIYCGFKYLAGYMDYVVFEFYNLKGYQRKTQVTRGINNQLVKTLNKKEAWHIFDNKDEFNEVFKDFLKRDWLNLSTASNEQIEAFLKNNEVFIVKPRAEACGKGVEKLKSSDFNSADELKGYCLKNNQIIVEQFIYQHDKLNSLFRNCVNTVRCVTINNNGKITPVFCSIRIGAGDTIVDNLNSGGMAALVDSETGIITTDAADKNGKVFEIHPDSNTVIKGFELPDFKEAMDLVKKAASVVSDIGYTGWDIAFTNNGPLLIEGNHFPGHDIYQMPALTQNGIGVLPKFKEAMN